MNKQLSTTNLHPPSNMTAIVCYAYLDLDGRGYIMEDEYTEEPLRELMAEFASNLPLHCFWGTPDYIDLDLHGRREPIKSKEFSTEESPSSSYGDDCDNESIRSKVMESIRSRVSKESLKKVMLKTRKVLRFLTRKKESNSERSNPRPGSNSAARTGTGTVGQVLEI